MPLIYDNIAVAVALLQVVIVGSGSTAFALVQYQFTALGSAILMLTPSLWARPLPAPAKSVGREPGLDFHNAYSLHVTRSS